VVLGEAGRKVKVKVERARGETEGGESQGSIIRRSPDKTGRLLLLVQLATARVFEF